MCSVTFWPRRGGYLLGMNRDENLTRVAGLPPARFVVGPCTVVHPREPNGGSWFSVNDRGVGVALINWYAIAAQAPMPVASRGGVVLALRDCATPEEAASRLNRLPLAQTNPFRVIGFFEPEQRVCEWRWDLRELAGHWHGWTPAQWLSSGQDEPEAQRVRGATFDRARTEADAGSLSWLRRLHASHGPERGPFSTCMHRAEAATVSYTEAEVTETAAALRYCGGPLCGAGAWVSETLGRRSAGGGRAVD